MVLLNTACCDFSSSIASWMLLTEGKTRGGEEAGAWPCQSCWWWEEVGWFLRHEEEQTVEGRESEEQAVIALPGQLLDSPFQPLRTVVLPAPFPLVVILQKKTEHKSLLWPPGGSVAKSSGSWGSCSKLPTARGICLLPVFSPSLPSNPVPMPSLPGA